jgi:quinol monooxygenase YgiN
MAQVALKVALVVRLVAKSGKEEEVRAFLAGAEPLARGESFTPAWFALRTAPNVFYIVDAFADDADRGKHLGGEIAKALMAKAPELLAEPPAIEKAEVLAAKVPG